MLRDAKIFGRNPCKIPQSEASNENLLSDSSFALKLDPNRPPLSSIQEPVQNPTHDSILKRSVQKTPSKNQTRVFLEHRTPERPKNRFGRGLKSEPGSDNEGGSQLPPLKNGARRNHRKASSVQSDCSSTQSTPGKSVTKPGFYGVGSVRTPLSVGRTMNCNVGPKACSVYVASEVPHFELREDPSFWMDHNVQVVIRVRPINSTEQNLQGYSRCLKQESAQSITWMGQPETRFSFDYVACETISQEMLFRVAGLPMVENCMFGYNSCMFAYGQTGSGKTYTMLGEIAEPEHSPSADRGMTPRIFEFLFARIKAEEESRRDEKLKYNCKCSFLEIYNEQITDLLDPSSTNLLLREDVRKGVYVKNLAEFEVETVNDILNLLFQGATNRKVAATNMNRESSRSHSVFTCVIESRWEKDSATNLRFARLNLVDLAGSERQKTSGAEGERLKEAASINKSLSTLGHVIMVLADAARGKQRHVPYRDSRLTFLLQDSLGGNSKTMIIANISPSICSANETLSTLKFAQRARLVQNNAVVNEDASGDISAMRHQIRLLKEELLLLKRQNVSRSLSFHTTITGKCDNEVLDDSSTEDLCGVSRSSADDVNNIDSSQSLRSLEATLAGALRREKLADYTIKQLEAEIEQLNHLVRQREEDTRCSKMMLKFREEKIQRMEALVNGQLPPDLYLMEENNAQSEEIELLKRKADRNPEVTRFALENIRLLEQLRRFQEFYEGGERELLLNDVSELHDQLLLILDGKSEQDQQSMQEMVIQENSHPQVARPVRDYDSLCKELTETSQELEQCRNKLNSCLETNERLTREMNNMHTELSNIKSTIDDQHINFDPENMDLCLDSPHSSSLPQHLVNKADENLNFQLELDILKIILGEEKSSRMDLEKRAIETESELRGAKEKISEHGRMENELKDAKCIIEALEAQQIIYINELEELRESNFHYLELLKKQEQETIILKKQTGASPYKSLKNIENENSPLQKKLKWMQASLEKAKNLNTRFQSDQVSQTSLEQEKDEVRRQVEMETTEVIVCMQEELTILQQSLRTMENESNALNERLSYMTQDNEKLKGLLEGKESELRFLSEDWEKLGHEITEALANGNIAIEDASDSITEQIGNIIRSFSEKDMLIEELQKCLDDAHKVKSELEWKLSSLRGATLAITEAQQKERSEREGEIFELNLELSEKTCKTTELENNIRVVEQHLRNSGMCAISAFIIVNRLSEINAALKDQIHNQVEAEKEMEAMKLQLEQFRKEAGKLLLHSCPADGFIEGEDNLLHTQDGIAINGDTASKEQLNIERRNKLEFDGEKTIALLRRELESALDSLRGVQGKMAKLHDEKEEVRLSEIQSQIRIEQLTVEVVRLSSEISDNEQQFEVKLMELDEKLKIVEESAASSNICRCKIKEEHAIEINNANVIATQKTIEASNLLKKVEKVQETMRETDLMINALMKANETTKLELERQKAGETMLLRDMKSFQSSLDVEKQEHELTKKNFLNTLTESRNMFFALEDTFVILQGSFIEKFKLLESELDWLKSLVQHNIQSVRVWLEEIWSEIIGKDCAVTVLHLCHMGILLERITGLSAENSFLNRGLCDSNLVISDLKKHNSKAKNELELCSVLKGKLLVDINNSFNRITKKENETAELKNRLNSFEEKIERLQLQEVIMLDRSNSMNTELANLMKELDASNRNAFTLISAKEKRLMEKEELNYQLEKVLNFLNDIDGRVLLLKEKIYRESSEHNYMVNKFLSELELVELSAKELSLHNSYLHSELSRKDELIKGLSFDLNLLQESASIAKDQNDNLEDAVKTLGEELDNSIAQIELLEDQLLEKNERIVVLELELTEKQSALQWLSSENHELKGQMKCILENNNTNEEELSKKCKVINRIEDELSDLSNLRLDMKTLAKERDHLDSMVIILKDQIEMARALAEEHEAIATEARQIAEERKIYAAEKEEEIKLLEKTVEELECTVTALENKAEFVRGEAEKQRLKREELEMEFESVRHQMLTLPATTSNIWKISDWHLKEKVTELQEAQKNIQNLQKEIVDKDAEILQCKTHISELNMHAEAQASEYKQKFKELDAMARQVKSDTISSNSTSMASTKSEKSATKSRGSGSPFKCIGLGMVQQINSEKTEELAASKRQIEELEALAASRQKEIFMLNTRLAAAESMTHDVIRDLLGVKLDMTSCAAMLNRDQIEQFSETSMYGDQEHKKDQLVAKLKKHLSKFIEERESWLDEINQRHTEMMSARIALEKSQQREQFLTTENEILKVESAKCKKAVMELEDEVKKLYEQQNLHQRIHHHVKIKEENKMLRILNEDLRTKLERSDSVHSRVTEELARYRAARGKKPFVDIDEEEKLRRKLDDCEDERIQLAQNLVSLCTCILKVAGLSRSSSAIINTLEAEDALCRIKEQITSLESEVHDLKLRGKLSSEKIRLLELKQDDFPFDSMTSSSFYMHYHDEAVDRG